MSVDSWWWAATILVINLVMYYSFKAARLAAADTSKPDSERLVTRRFWLMIAIPSAIALTLNLVIVAIEMINEYLV